MPADAVATVASAAAITYTTITGHVIIMIIIIIFLLLFTVRYRNNAAGRARARSVWTMDRGAVTAAGDAVTESIYSFAPVAIFQLSSSILLFRASRGVAADRSVRSARVCRSRTRPRRYRCAAAGRRDGPTIFVSPLSSSLLL